MTIELRHLIKLKKKRSPVVMVQRVMRASVDRRWVRRRRKMGMWAAVRIQSAARYARWRKSMLHSIDKFLLEVEPRVRLPCLCCMPACVPPCVCACVCVCVCQYVHAPGLIRG